MTHHSPVDPFDALLEEAAHESSLLVPGTSLLDGRFVIRKLIGSGGMGVVYEALDTVHQSVVVVKTITSIGGEGIYRLKHEFRSLAHVVHPHLVGLHELFIDGKLCFFTMERIIGKTLMEYLGANASNEKVVGVFAQLAVGIQAIHDAGKLHRDLKPSNVMVTPQGKVVILDFGLACDQLEDEDDDSEQTWMDQLSGTPVYISPEQIDGEVMTQAGDWYAFGVMLYEVLFGQPPFMGSNHTIMMHKVQRDAPVPESGNPRVSKQVQALCFSLLSRDPMARPGFAEISALLFERKKTNEHPLSSLDEDVLVGRDQELMLLEDALESTHKGAPMAVVIRGASGVGKSALLACFARQVEQDGRAIVLSSRCYERESVPYKGCDALIDAVSRYLRRQPDERVAAVLPRRVQALIRVFPVFERLQVLTRIRQRVPLPKDPVELRRQGESALKEMLCRLAEQDPVVLIIDDFQWSDVDGARLLSSLLTPPDAPPGLWIVAHRSEDTHKGGGLEIVKRALRKQRTIPHRYMTIEPLNHKDGLALAQQLSPGVSSDILSKIVHQSEGSPFFISMLSRFSDKYLPLDRYIVDDAIKVTMDKLTPDAGVLFEAVCVSGRAVTVQLLRTVTGLVDILPALKKLLAEQLVRSTSSINSVAVYHDRIRESVLHSMAPERLKLWHQKFVNAIVVLGVPDPMALTHHHLGAGNLELAGKSAIPAAKRAETALAFGQAAELYEIALSHAVLSPHDRKTVLERLALVLINGFRPAQAAKAFLDASSLADTEEERSNLRTKGAEQLFISGQVDEGVSIIEAAFSEHGLDYRALVTADYHAMYEKLIRRGLTYQRQEESDIASEVRRRLETQWCATLGLTHIKYEETFRLALHYAEDSLAVGAPIHIARSFSNVAIYESTLMPKEPLALHFLEQLAEQEQTPLVELYLALTKANIAQFFSEPHAVLEAAEYALNLILETGQGLAREMTIARNLILMAHVKTGNVLALAQNGTTWLAELTEQSNRYLSSWMHVYLVIYYLAKGDLQAARRSLKRGSANESGDSPDILGITTIQYDALCDAFEDNIGGIDKVRSVDRIFDARPRLLENPMKLCDHAFMKGIVILRLLKSHSELTPLCEEVLRCAEVLEGIEKQGRTVSFSYWLPHAQMLKAGVAAAQGDIDAVATHLDTALELFNTTDTSALVGAAVMVRKGRLLGGDKGAMCIQQGMAALSALGVTHREGVVDLFAPVFWAQKGDDSIVRKEQCSNVQ